MPRDTNWHACRTTIDGHEAGVLIGRDLPTHLPQAYNEHAFVELAPGVVLEIAGDGRRSQATDPPDQFLSFLQTLRVVTTPGERHPGN